MLTLKCIECGSEFEAQRSTAKFCSAKCRVKWNGRKDDDELNELPDLSPTMVVEKKELKEVPQTFDGDKLTRMRAVMDSINKDFGEGTIMFMGDKPKISKEAISTGLLSVDYALGIGGFPRGRIVEIYGQESSGKTTIALSTIAEAQKKGLGCAFIDAEHAFDTDYAKLLGVNMEMLFLSQPNYGEEALESADRCINSKEYGVIVIDSVAALIPKGELEGEMGDSKMGLQARLMSQACRKLVSSVSKTNTLLIFLNQLREKIGMTYGNPFVTTGGNALKFYASIRLDVRKSVIKDGDEMIGSRVTVKVAKSKVAPPFKTAEFDIIYGEGIDRISDIISMAVQKNVIQKSGSWYSYNNDKLGQGSDAVKQLLNDNTELLQEIKQKLTTQ